MKTMGLLFLCIAFSTAKEVPNGTQPQSKTALELRAAVTKWRAKLEEYNTPERRKSQVYLELLQQMEKDLQEIRDGNNEAVESSKRTELQKSTNASNVIKVNGKLAKNIAPGGALRLQDRPPVSSPEFVITDTTIHEIPFSSKENTIEISVTNSANLTAQQVKVELMNAPSWLNFAQQSVSFAALKSKEEQSASFDFSVDKLADVGKMQTLQFSITDKSGQRWINEVTVKVAPPATYDLFQNYPNPFNPTTTIEYQLPGVGSPFNVSLKVYDMLGREVESLMSGQQETGYYQSLFDAHRFASGVYIYRLVATDNQNKRHVFQKKMLLVK